MQTGHTCESEANSWSPGGLRTEITAKIFDLETISDRGSLVAQRVKNLPAMQETWVGKILKRRKWLLTPVFLPEESYGRRNLAGYSPRGCKNSAMTKVT